MSNQSKHNKQIKSNITGQWETVSVAVISASDAEVLSNNGVRYVEAASKPKTKK